LEVTGGSGGVRELAAGDSALIPAETEVALLSMSADASLLDIEVPSSEARDVLSRVAREPDAVATYGSASTDQRVEIYLPASTDSAPAAPLLMLLHGGFWRPAYGADHVRPLAAALADAGYAVCNTEYRRAPGAPEESVSDVMCALAAAPAAAAAAGARHDGRVLLVGHSAGGYLGMLAATRVKSEDVPVLAGVLALAPVAYLAVAAALGLDNGSVDAFLGHDGVR
jgi:acetyl esterase/lipase